MATERRRSASLYRSSLRCCTQPLSRSRVATMLSHSMDGTPRVESSGSAGHSILRYVVYETRLEQSDIGQIATQSPSKPANVSIRLLCPPALCLPIPNSGDASLLLSGQFGVPALGDVSPPASRIPVVRWRIFNDFHKLMVSDPLGTQLCMPTNPLSKPRTSQRSEHRGRCVEATVAINYEPLETMPFVIPLDRRSSTEVLLRQ